MWNSPKRVHSRTEGDYATTPYSLGANQLYRPALDFTRVLFTSHAEYIFGNLLTG